MNIDEYKALRLRRSLLKAEIASINVRLDAYDAESKSISRPKTWFERWKELWRGFEVGEDYPDARPIDEEEPAHPVPPKPKPGYRSPSRLEDRDVPMSPREKFYRDAENDFRNTDSNGNYVTPPEDC